MPSPNPFESQLRKNLASMMEAVPLLERGDASPTQLADEARNTQLRSQGVPTISAQPSALGELFNSVVGVAKSITSPLDPGSGMPNVDVGMASGVKRLSEGTWMKFYELLQDTKTFGPGKYIKRYFGSMDDLAQEEAVSHLSDKLADIADKIPSDVGNEEAFVENALKGEVNKLYKKFGSEKRVDIEFTGEEGGGEIAAEVDLANLARGEERLAQVEAEAAPISPSAEGAPVSSVEQVRDLLEGSKDIYLRKVGEAWRTDRPTPLRGSAIKFAQNARPGMEKSSEISRQLGLSRRGVEENVLPKVIDAVKAGEDVTPTTALTHITHWMRNNVPPFAQERAMQKMTTAEATRIRRILDPKSRRIEGDAADDLDMMWRMYEKVPDRFKSGPIPSTYQPLKPKTTTLYRAESSASARIPDWVRENESYKSMRSEATGRWYTDSKDALEWYKKDIGEGVVVKQIELPAEEAEKYRVVNLPKDAKARRYSLRPEEEFFLPHDLIMRGKKQGPPK